MTERSITPSDEAAILAEALPYIKRFHGKTITSSNSAATPWSTSTSSKASPATWYS